MSRTKRKRHKREKRVDETSYLTGVRRDAVLKEEVWFEGDRIVKYSLAYINPKVFSLDNGRVLGYDNAHDHHHRHFMGKVERIDFESYEALADRFQGEVHELWRIEDEQES